MRIAKGSKRLCLRVTLSTKGTEKPTDKIITELNRELGKGFRMEDKHANPLCTSL